MVTLILFMAVSSLWIQNLNGAENSYTIDDQTNQSTKINVIEKLFSFLDITTLNSLSFFELKNSSYEKNYSFHEQLTDNNKLTDFSEENKVPNEPKTVKVTNDNETLHKFINYFYKALNNSKSDNVTTFLKQEIKKFNEFPQQIIATKNKTYKSHSIKNKVASAINQITFKPKKINSENTTSYYQDLGKLSKSIEIQFMSINLTQHSNLNNETTEKYIELSTSSRLKTDILDPEFGFKGFLYRLFRETYEIINECDSGNSSGDFPKDIFTEKQKRHGAIILHIICCIYCFTLLAVICNEYFLPSVGCIVEALHLSKDVGAATFMAIATSAPELFVNFISTFVTESDMGIGTIVGSALFNTLGVASLGGLAAVAPIQLDWWPLSRDCIVYSSVIIILVATVHDNVIRWYEALFLLCLYVVYFAIMFNNDRISTLFSRCVNKCRRIDANDTDSVKSEEQKKKTLFTKNTAKLFSFEPMDLGLFNYKHEEISDSLEEGVSQNSTDTSTKSLVSDGTPSLWKIPKSSKLLKFWFFYTWPLKFILYLTLPDCKRYPKMYPLTFIMCVIWIGVNSYMVSWMISVIGDTFEIPDSIMGLTFLAAGGCLPEAISIIIMSRKGEGSMGVSNSLGANTMDILLALALPWFIKALLNGSKEGGHPYVEIVSDGMQYTVLCLLPAVILLYTTIACAKYRMGKVVGVVLMVVYILFLSAAITAEVIFKDYC